MSFLVLAGARGSSSGGGGSEGFPDLETLYGVPWTVTWPTAPNITNGEQVVTPANYTGHLNSPGKRIIFSAGTYETAIVLDGDNTDMEFVVQSNVILPRIDFNTGAARIKWTWETPRDPTSYAYVFYSGATETPEDILLDGVHSDDEEDAGLHPKLEGTRIAIINSWMKSASYNHWSEATSLDVNLYNNTFEGGANAGNAQSACRFTSGHRWAVCRNRWVKHNTGLLIRIYTEGDFQFSDNQVEAAESSGSNAGCVLDTSGGTGEATGDFGTRFLRNHVWNDSGGPLNTGVAGSSTGPVLIQDNVSHGDAWPGSGPTGYTFVNNTDVAFAAPDAWSYL
jgi:hypothetical protein